MLYFDHAATSFPKPVAVGEAMQRAVVEFGANPGRGGHQLSQKAADIVEKARTKVASLFGAPSSKHIWFYPNATYALNQAILGFPFNEKDEVVTTHFEHNSVLRPLHHVKNQYDLTICSAGGKTGTKTAQEVISFMTNKTSLVVINHASNVTGEIIPLEGIAKRAKEVNAVLLVDASQTAGIVNIELVKDGIDMIACPGHKGLLGPQGTGILAVKDDYQLKPVTHGGTGHFSELPYQPEQWPERYEAGTLNTPGLAGLIEGINELESIGGLQAIYEHENKLLHYFMERLNKIQAVTLFGSEKSTNKVAVLSFTIAGISSQEVAIILDQHYQIAVRSGLHCAPKLHEWYGTLSEGLIRVSFGPYTTMEDVEQLAIAIEEIAEAF